MKTREKVKRLKNRIKEHPATFITYVVLRALVILVLVISANNHSYENVFVCTMALLLFLAPAFIEENFGIDVPDVLEIIIMLFIFASLILGEIASFYMHFPFWDVILHSVNGFLCAAIGFALVDILNRNSREKFRLSPFYLAVVSFCFSMTIGVVWEFFEFSCDVLLHTDMQKDTVINFISSTALGDPMANVALVIDNIKNVTVDGAELGVGGYLDIGLVDTMNDLFVNFIGAVIFSVIGYFYVKNRGKSTFAEKFIPKVARDVKNAQTAKDENTNE